jgi:hypothetical protein
MHGSLDTSILMNLDFNQIAHSLIGFRSVPVARGACITFFAVEYFSKRSVAAFDAHGPWAIDPGRIMPDMLIVPAFQLCDPVAFFVLMIANDFSLHCSGSFDAVLVSQL